MDEYRNLKDLNDLESYTKNYDGDETVKTILNNKLNSSKSNTKKIRKSKFSFPVGRTKWKKDIGSLNFYL